MNEYSCEDDDNCYCEDSCPYCGEILSRFKKLSNGTLQCPSCEEILDKVY